MSRDQQGLREIKAPQELRVPQGLKVIKDRQELRVPQELEASQELRVPKVPQVRLVPLDRRIETGRESLVGCILPIAVGRHCMRCVIEYLVIKVCYHV